MSFSFLRAECRIYVTEQVRKRVFEILKELLPNSTGGEGKADPNNGRPGMSQWEILVLGVLRLGDWQKRIYRIAQDFRPDSRRNDRRIVNYVTVIATKKPDKRQSKAGKLVIIGNPAGWTASD
ncbi:MAG: hypothetical protein BECKG1743F_GA0114225_108722 [Candidatus Kentron sp. G]|nr:MAG: hypothetical protein BECKG1743F_GA0114225_108722 [Candidatus Kentron sp. G]VFN05264.1 MAG: hypothetical protein BECKG1743E_GA0114224_108402 [Candidatus Kentron sp. G]